MVSPGAVVQGYDLALLRAKEAAASRLTVRSPLDTTSQGGSPMSDQSAQPPVTADPPEPPASEDSGATPADVVDAIEERVFSERGNPADEVEPGPAEDEPVQEPPE
jgi:hypothetical protein